MKALVLLNPPVGSNDAQDVREALTRHFQSAGIEHEVYETREGDRLADMVRRRLCEGFDFVVAAGGDGTVSAAADGLVGSVIPLGIIPTGTGNLVARELDIPLEVEAAVALLAGTPRTRKIDVMRIGTRTFVLNVSVGISASVIGATTRWSKRIFGRAAYIGVALVKGLVYRPRYLMVVVDGAAHPYRAYDVSIMNCGLLGRQLYPKGPEIRMDDGRLGVWIVCMKSIWGYPRYLLGVAAGRSMTADAQFIRAEKKVSIRSRFPLIVQADGDVIGTTPVEVEVLPGAITVYVPGEDMPVP